MTTGLSCSQESRGLPSAATRLTNCMVRKRKLPEGVTAVIDRHGRERFRYRRKGLDFYLKAHPQTREGQAIIKQAEQGIMPRKSRVVPRSMGDLFERFYASARFNRGGDKWRQIVRATLEEFRHEARDIPVSDFTDGHVETILSRRAKQTVVGGKKRGGPAAAERLHEQLMRLFDFAQNKLRWIDHNPAREADSPVGRRKGGYHIWTREEIERFQERHSLGTKPRLAMEIAFWTGLRRGDVARFGPDNIKGGRVSTVASKTTKDVDVILAPELKVAIEAMPEVGKDTFLVTGYGKPFTDAGLGNWFRERCNEAGLPHCSMHGLRKALATIAADEGATQQQLKALGQWSNDSEVATYTAAANQRKLADAAIQMVIQSRTLSNRPKRLDK
jgi:integrase